MKQMRALAWMPMLLLLTGPVHAQTSDSFIADVVYGHKDGMALTFDVLTPPGQANGAGVLFMVSGGWVSRWTPPEDSRYSSRWQPLLDAGFTVFVVRHGSSPRYTVPEALSDVRRAIRFVRLHATEYDVDPNRLGAFGGSAGGHLSLLLGLASDDGDPAATDEILRGSSHVEAVVAYYPPADLRTRVMASKDFPPSHPDEALSFASGVVQPQTTERFPAMNFDESLLESVSPILHISSDDPPTLLIHGDADTLVDVNNSRLMHRVLKNEGVVTDLMVIEGAGHGFEGQDADRASSAVVNWFLTHLVEAN